ncbi:hypothetical protein DFH09DRAFT_1112207 [Mycena vulgaris]|nr:hypothetical protein DFH09DRAFT_1112207 [Mycena vulgaris]
MTVTPTHRRSVKEVAEARYVEAMRCCVEEIVRELENEELLRANSRAARKEPRCPIRVEPAREDQGPGHDEQREGILIESNRDPVFISSWPQFHYSAAQWERYPLLGNSGGPWDLPPSSIDRIWTNSAAWRTGFNGELRAQSFDVEGEGRGEGDMLDGD